MTSYDQDYGQPIVAEPSGRALSDAARTPPRLPLVGPHLESLKAYPPGRPWRELAAELGIPPAEMLLLAANENVLGPSPRAIEASRAALEEAHLYPDGAGTALRRALSERLGVPVSSLLLGNGSNEIIELLVRTFTEPEETVVTGWPSFVVYRLATQAHGRQAMVDPLQDHRYDLRRLAGLVDHRTKLVFIANPNNPTGTYVGHEEVEHFLQEISPSAIVVLDEAYLEYVTAEDFPRSLELLSRFPRLVILRTFSKAHGLAGLRIGYGIMAPELVSYVDRVRQPYNVSSVAQAAALGALADDEHIARSRALVTAGLEQLEAGALRLGLETVPSQANFILVKMPLDADYMQEELRSRGVLVRSMRGYGMPDYIRVTVGTQAMNETVLSNLSDLLQGQNAR